MATRERIVDEASVQKPPWYRDVRILRILVQVGIVVVVFGILAYLVSNLLENMRRQGIDTGFGYLNQPAETTIPGSSFRKTQTRWEAILVGVANTFRVAFAGIIVATILGVLLGIARLSKNWLVSTGARLYVEFFRNIPLLVIIIFAYLAIFLQFPSIGDAREPLGISVVSVRGVHVPWYEGGTSFRPYVVILLGAAIIGVLVAQYRTRIHDATGVPHRRVLFGGGVFLLIAAAGYFVLDSPFTISVPDLTDGLVEGGIRLPPEYAALLMSLVIYTASHIAEITRASIQSVHKGQREAAMALALSGFQRMRYVILPQAFRVAIPPLANQYLNLTKNSSLAIAIAYYELTKVTNDLIANGGPAPQSFVLLMLIYLVLSLGIAAITNYANRRLALVER